MSLPPPPPPAPRFKIECPGLFHYGDAPGHCPRCGEIYKTEKAQNPPIPHPDDYESLKADFEALTVAHNQEHERRRLSETRLLVQRGSFVRELNTLERAIQGEMASARQVEMLYQATKFLHPILDRVQEMKRRFENVEAPSPTGDGGI